MGHVSTYFQAKRNELIQLAHLILLPCSHIITLSGSSSAEYLHVRYCAAMSRPLPRPISPLVRHVETSPP